MSKKEPRAKLEDLAPLMEECDCCRFPVDKEAMTIRHKKPDGLPVAVCPICAMSGFSAHVWESGDLWVLGRLVAFGMNALLLTIKRK